VHLLARRKPAAGNIQRAAGLVSNVVHRDRRLRLRASGNVSGCLTDDSGNRLANERISDDYAAIWMCNVGYAKEMARQTFLWMAEMFESADLTLVDMCAFIDREGKTIYGEISPDCMS
jgi:hypothetical protein